MTRVPIAFHNGLKLVDWCIQRCTQTAKECYLFLLLFYVLENSRGSGEGHALLSLGSFAYDAHLTSIFHPQYLWHLLLDFIKFILYKSIILNMSPLPN